MLKKNKLTAMIDEAKFEKIAGRLTETERKILRLIALGYNNQEISDALIYTNSYVRKVVSVIYEKNFVSNRTELKKLLH